MADCGITSTIVGHVGDGETYAGYADIERKSFWKLLGNFHALMLFRNDEELHTVTEAVHRLIYRAIALDGTCACALFMNRIRAKIIMQVLANMASVSERRSTCLPN